MKWIRILPIVILMAGQYGCKKSEDTVPNTPFALIRMSIDGVTVNGATHMNVHPDSDIRLTFGQPVDNLSLVNAIDFRYNDGLSVTFGAQLENKDSTIRIGGSIGYLTKSLLKINTQLKSKGGGSLAGPITLTFVTRMDSADKFPVISDDSLLTLVQKNTFDYFFYLANPVSGLAHERHSPGVVSEPVTSGGSGFGIMGLVVGVHRGFITRAEGLARMQ